MKAPDRIIALLDDRDDGFWPLADLARAAGVGPARLETALDELRRRGHELELSPTLGIRLRRPTVLDAHLIERGLGTARVGRNVIVFAELDSTNDTAAASARQPGADGLAVLAERQRRGRGRHGRRWISPPGANVLMSVLLLDDGRLPREALTVSAGLAVAEAIEALHPLACALKWPNDVLIEGGKVSGVLVERRSDPAAGGHCVVGIGVNVGAHPPPDQVDRPATSLAAHLPGPVDRIALARELLRRLDAWVARLSADAANAAKRLREDWSRRCGMLNERVTIASAGRRHTGRVVDIDPLAGLVLLTDDGTRLHLPAGSASVVDERRR